LTLEAPPVKVRRSWQDDVRHLRALITYLELT